jgi:hypothetical protein
MTHDISTTKPGAANGTPGPPAALDPLTGLGLVPRARTVAWWLAGWSLAYACFRGYYAAGGRFAMVGQPHSQAAFNHANALGAGIIIVFAVIGPLVMMHVGVLRRWLLPTAGWAGAVGCCMHALVDMTLRVFSLVGVHPTQLPMSFWQSFNRRTADLQDLLLKEPWFFVDGLLWAALAVAILPRTRVRSWLGSAALACAALTTYGVLRGLDVLGHTPLG